MVDKYINRIGRRSIISYKVAEINRWKDKIDKDNKYTLHKYYLISNQDIDLGKLAENIIEIQGVHMVDMKERDNKILIKTQLSNEIDQDNFKNILVKKINNKNNKYGKIIEL
ncbi:MAG: hypothetical protein ACP5LH_00535 [Candidatus Micrarchaeia archaeon]